MRITDKKHIIWRYLNAYKDNKYCYVIWALDSALTFYPDYYHNSIINAFEFIFKVISNNPCIGKYAREIFSSDRDREFFGKLCYKHKDKLAELGLINI